jgi:hypothetical protein
MRDFNPSKELDQRALNYANARGIQLKYSLGSGKDGTAFSTNLG